MITFELLQKGATKTEVISQVLANDDVLFHWDFVMHKFPSVPTALLLDGGSPSEALLSVATYLSSTKKELAKTLKARKGSVKNSNLLQRIDNKIY